MYKLKPNDVFHVVDKEGNSVKKNNRKEINEVWEDIKEKMDAVSSVKRTIEQLKRKKEKIFGEAKKKVTYDMKWLWNAIITNLNMKL